MEFNPRLLGQFDQDIFQDFGKYRASLICSKRHVGAPLSFGIKKDISADLEKVTDVFTNIFQEKVFGPSKGLPQEGYSQSKEQVFCDKIKQTARLVSSLSSNAVFALEGIPEDRYTYSDGDDSYGSKAFSIKKNQIDAEHIDAEEIRLAEKAISDGAIRAMNEYFNTYEPSNEGWFPRDFSQFEFMSGVWYPEEYKKYLKNEFGIEMDPNLYSGLANEEFFDKIAPYTFQIKQGKKPSEALLSFLKGPTIADCGNATTACYYKSILDFIGEEKFNDFFTSPPFLFSISLHGVTDPTSPISKLVKYTEAARQNIEGIPGKRPLKVGEECHFAGVKWYANKHPAGSGGGWNVIYMGDNEKGQQLFMGHGFSKPLTEREIDQKLIRDYNEARTPQDEEMITKFNTPLLYDRYLNGYLRSCYAVFEEDSIINYNPGSPKTLNIEKIIKLKNMHVQEINELPGNSIFEREEDVSFTRHVLKSKLFPS